MPVSQPRVALRSVRSESPEATRTLAAALASVARPGDLIALHGDLGAGKTQFAKGFGAGLGVLATINSPSYVLLAEYQGRLPLFHLDLYRLEGAADASADVFAGGLIDERQAAGVTLVEWAERLGPALPIGRLDITFEGSGDGPRTIRVAATEPAFERYLAALP